MSDFEKGELECALLKYCELDTLAMVMIYEGWKEMLGVIMNLEEKLLKKYNLKTLDELFDLLFISENGGKYTACGMVSKSLKQILMHAASKYNPENRDEMKEKREEIEKGYMDLIENKKWEDIPIDFINKYSRKIVLTTSFFVANKKIENELGIITSECVFGMNYFKDIFAGFTDILGGRSKTTQKVFRDARTVSLDELRREALILDADAVIGIRVDYREISAMGKSGGMMMVVASGTAVKTKNIENNV